MRGYRVVGPFSQVREMEHIARKLKPDLTLDDIDVILRGRRFGEWYDRHKPVVNYIAAVTPMFTMKMFGIQPAYMSSLTPEAIPALAPDAAPVSGDFFAGHGVILLHMLIVGFLTLVVTTFLKFTGRGDLAPLVFFVGGGIILYEVLGLFKAIYTGIATFFNM